MLKECLDVFKKIYEEKGESLILDTYVPEEGSYVLVGEDGNVIKTRELKRMNEPPEDFDDFLEKDYCSKIFGTNKGIDVPKKKVHSNNYYSFWIKKENLKNDKKGLTNEIIDLYFDRLKEPKKKYKKKGLEIYHSVETRIGEPEIEIVEKHREWIKKHIFNIVNDLGLTDDKTYLKIFFSADNNVYQREGNRYYWTNVYNKNDYNINLNGEVFGVHDNNNGLNQDKPYLECRTRKNSLPYLISEDEVLLQKKFFDYLYNQALLGKKRIYLSKEKGIESFKQNEGYPQSSFNGYYMLIDIKNTKAKGNFVEIRDFDKITGYHSEIAPLELKQKIKYNGKNPLSLIYENVTKLKVIEGIVNEIFFFKRLVPNYYKKEKNIKAPSDLIKTAIIECRKGFIDWFYKGDETVISNVFPFYGRALTIDSICRGYRLRAIEQYNLNQALLAHFKGSNNVENKAKNIYDCLLKKFYLDREYKKEEIPDDLYMPVCDDEDEYYFIIGQLASYYISKARTSDVAIGQINNILNCRNNQKLKEEMLILYKKYNFAFNDHTKKFRRLCAMVAGESLKGKPNTDMILAGYLYPCIMYRKLEIYEEIKEGKENEK